MAPTRPLSLYKSNGSELPNVDVLSLFRQTTCYTSASIHFNTLNLRKIYSYSESRKFLKTPDCSLLSSSSSVQTAYCETGISNRSNSFTKIIYTGAYMILDKQNLHTFSQSNLHLTQTLIHLYYHLPTLYLSPQ